MNKRFPLPKRYWLYVSLSIMCAVLLLYNIFRTNSWTGDTPFSEFTKKEWQLFVIFTIEEIIIGILMIIFALLGGKFIQKRDKAMVREREDKKFSGIKPGDCDYVWFDFSCSERALIIKQREKYILHIHEYDEIAGTWEIISQGDTFDSLDEIKETLYFECDFYCEENSYLDKHGNEIYKNN